MSSVRKKKLIYRRINAKPLWVLVIISDSKGADVFELGANRSTMRARWWMRPVGLTRAINASHENKHAIKPKAQTSLLFVFLVWTSPQRFCVGWWPTKKMDYMDLRTGKPRKVPRVHHTFNRSFVPILWVETMWVSSLSPLCWLDISFRVPLELHFADGPH